MGVKKAFKKGFTQLTALPSEPGKNSMHADSSSGGGTPHNAMRSGDNQRPTNSGTRHESGSLPKTDPFGNRATSTIVSSKPGLTLPPHAAQATQDDTALDARPQVPRKPTTSNGPEGQRDNHVQIGEKPVPQLESIKSEAPLSDAFAVGPDGACIDSGHIASAVSDHGKSLGQAVDAQSRKIEEQAEIIQALREANQQHVATLEKISDDLQKEKDKHANTTQAWRKATAALSSHRQEANYKVDDDFLRGQYQNIIYDVGDWTATYCIADFGRIHESELRIFQSLTPQPHKYLHVPRTRELLLQSLVMHALVNSVLNFDSDSGLWWAGKQSAGLRAVQLAMEPDEPNLIPKQLKSGPLQSLQVREYSSWKAKTALLLSNNVKPAAIESNIGSVLAGIKPVLKPFVRAGSNAWRELGDVIYKAIMLDLELNKSRSLFKVHRWSVKDIEGMKFDPSQMESANGVQAAQRGTTVELALAPLVTKTGNADGDGFDVLSLISPWTVVCYDNRKQFQKA